MKAKNVVKKDLMNKSDPYAKYEVND